MQQQQSGQRLGAAGVYAAAAVVCAAAAKWAVARCTAGNKAVCMRQQLGVCVAAAKWAAAMCAAAGVCGSSEVGSS